MEGQEVNVPAVGEEGINYDDPLNGRKPWEWRMQEESDVAHYTMRQSILIDDRLESGRDQYGTGEKGSLFKGNPGTHLKQEAGDIMHYAEWIERKISALEQMMDRANQLIMRMSIMVPVNGTLITAFDIKRNIAEDLQNYNQDVKRMEYQDQEAQYQWVRSQT